MRFIPNKLSRTVARQVLKGQKHSPTLLFAVGVIGVVGTVILASRATLKVEAAVNDFEKDVALTKDRVTTNDYTEEQKSKDLAFLYGKHSLNIAKLYTPAVGVGVISIACLTGSHVVLTRRNVAMTAAYATVQKAFDGYRNRVIDEYGPAKDVELYHGTETREYLVETDTGPQVVKDETFPGASGYARLFNHHNSNWNRTPEYNLLFLRAQQNYLNDKLKSRGHVLLNDAYDALGVDRSPAGAVVGWVMGNGDSYIDFGIWDDRNMDRLHDFVTGREGAILLDFNVDGVVYKLI